MERWASPFLLCIYKCEDFVYVSQEQTWPILHEGDRPEL